MSTPDTAADVDRLFRERGKRVNAARQTPAYDPSRLCPVCNSLLLPGETVETCAGCEITRALDAHFGPPPPPVDLAVVADRAAAVLDSWGRPGAAATMRRAAGEIRRDAAPE